MSAPQFADYLQPAGSSIVHHCACGRVHFCDDDDFAFDEGELAGLLQKQAEHPDQYFLRETNPGIIELPLLGQRVFGCPCGWDDDLGRLIQGLRKEIHEYFTEMAKYLMNEYVQSRITGQVSVEPDRAIENLMLHFAAQVVERQPIEQSLTVARFLKRLAEDRVV